MFDRIPMTTICTRLAACSFGAIACAAPIAATSQESAHAQAYAQAQSASTSRMQARPRVALVLAGGGARGAAHVGVLKVLEELRVPVDCIVGTSMGALVGGGYAAGLTAAEVERLIGGLDWKSIIGGLGSRMLEPAEQKRLDDMSGTLEFGLRDGRLASTSALVSSSRIEDVLRGYVAQARGIERFDDLPIPYRAVAVDLLSGDVVVLDRGDLASAMRASMAIPGVFAPVATPEHLLVDGGALRNLPVDVGRDTCGDVVIAVNLVKPPARREQLTGPLQILLRNMEVMGQAAERAQLGMLGARDVRVDVDIGDVATQDFHRTADAMVAGERAAREMAPRLGELAVSPDEYRAWRAARSVDQRLDVRVAAVEFEGLGYVSPEYLRSLTRIAPGDTVDAAAIGRDADRMSALHEIDGVDYELRGPRDGATLVWRPVESALGRDVFRPSLGLYGDRDGEQRFEVGFDHVRRWLNPLGGQWRNELRLGSTTLLRTGVYQPLEATQTYFVEPFALVRDTREDVFIAGDRIARFEYVDAGGGLDLGANVARDAQLRVGYWAMQRDLTWDIGLQLLPAERVTDAGWHVQATWDDRDAATYATRGSAAAVRHASASESLGATRRWHATEGAIRHVLGTGRAVIDLTLAGGDGGSLPGDRLFSLGGPRSFPGFAPGELRVASYWTAAVGARWRLADLVRLTDQSIGAGFAVQAAGVDGRLDGGRESGLYGVSAYVGGRTPVGTLTLGAGKTNDTWSSWLTLGRPIGSGSILDWPIFR